jgi:hypothetical protein
MSDCYYQRLKKNEMKVNRMGTENYILADFDKKTKDIGFDKEPINLKVDRNASYTKLNKSLLMKTSKRDAKVEYFLTKWKLSKNGGI